MANITAAMVKELRERTGAGMMECKKALTETNGDIEAAIDLMRKTGLAKADKKSDRAAAEGLLLVRQNGSKALILEVNCETDFVTKNEDFLKFANDAADIAINNNISTVEELSAHALNDSTVDEVRKSLIAKIGENMNVRRLTVLNGSCLVGTISDTRTIETDESGALIKELIESQGHICIDRVIVRDEKQEIQQMILDAITENQVDAILLTGGTGISSRDVTIEAVEKMFEKDIPGFGELFRMVSYQEDIGSAAMMSRATAGVVNGKVIFAMPGSTKAVKLAMEKLILPEIGHIYGELHKHF